ncbi:MAG TPA: DUF2378 family protein [Myxococcaceae bacterium]|nr:DUF2378 family protein [Myxococcaceae bacterium]
METGSQAELEQRLALARPEDTLRGFFFTAALKVVRNECEGPVLSRCLEASGESRFMAFFSYPMGPLLRLLYAAAWGLSEKHGGFEAAMRHLGRQVVPDYLESSAGRLLTMLPVGAPKLLLDNLPPAYRTAVMHGACSVTWLGPNYCLLVLQGTALPLPYVEGAVLGLFELLKMKTVKVVERQEGPRELRLSLSW